MKLVIAFVQDKDCTKLVKALNLAEFRSTRLATTGNFLKQGNSTLIMGIEDARLDELLEIIKEHSHTRKEFATNPLVTGMLGEVPHQPVEVIVGGATVLIMPLERMVRF